MKNNILDGANFCCSYCNLEFQSEEDCMRHEHQEHGIK